MVNCEFCIIKYAPDMVRFEPVNIGIALMDKEKKLLHNRFITNFDELFARLGTDKVHGLKQSFENYLPVMPIESTEHLQKLHEGFHGSVSYSKPIKIASDQIHTVLDQIFDKMISIKEEPNVREYSIRKIKKTIQEYFSQFNLPNENYCEQYDIKDVDIPQIRQFAFLKEGQLHHTIDAFNFANAQINNSLQLFMYDVGAIAESTRHSDNKPHVFSAESTDSGDITKRTRKNIDLLLKKNIDVVSPENHLEKLDEIKEQMIQAA